jgi:glycine/D-amino acid oxidase-like deaminating enzyme
VTLARDRSREMWQRGRIMRVAVLGAGLQGACLAFELARGGAQVDVYDRHRVPVSGDSANNEGKIHLGYVYAADRTRRTARLMVDGALGFAPLMRRWLGPAFDEVPVSEPFTYLVHRESLLSVDDVEAHLAACHGFVVEELAGRAADYFGRDLNIAPQRLSRAETERWYEPATTLAAFRTQEVAVDTAALARVVRAQLAVEPAIRLRLGTEVHAVSPGDDSAAVHAARDGHETADRYDHVVNALWAGRLAVDLTAGVAAPRPWLHRIRYNLRISGQFVGVPATTIVLGPFGDAVAYGSDGLYLSWYPDGRQDASAEVTPPAWPVTLDEPDSARLRTAIGAGLGRSIRAVAALPDDVLAAGEVVGGIVFAHGADDIDHPDSELHERHRIGPVSFGRYHSVDTGKLTTAPLFAHRLAGAIRVAAETAG